MKTKLLIATAAATLLAGTAFAQSPTTMPPSQSSPGASGAVKSGGSMDSKGSMSAPGGNSGAATTGAGVGAGSTTETNKADDFKTKGASDQKRMQDQKGAQQQKSGAGKSETTGQAPRGGTQGDTQQTDTQQRSGSGAPQRGQAGEMNRNQPNDNQRSGAAAGGDTRANVNLSTEQRTRIKEVIVKDKRAPRVANVNFSINVGTTIPRTVTHVVVPRTIVEIYPAWRGYHYFMAGDQIVIIDPATMRIVAVLDA